MGGGVLFRSLVEQGLVDTVEVAVVPVLLGGGIPILPAHAQRVQLKLIESKASANGTVSLKYLVQR